MRLPAQFRTFITLLPLLALVFIQSVGGHLHVCLDGFETRVSVQTTSHLSDFFSMNSAHDHHEPASDVDVDDNAWLTPKAGMLDHFIAVALVAACAALLIFSLARQLSRPLSRDPEPISSVLLKLRPPLRGPPASSVI